MMTCHLQFCTVALVATVCWPVCWLCGASRGWLAWHFHFLAWTWFLSGGFAVAVWLSELMERKLAEWAATPAREAPLAWLMLAGVVLVALLATVWLLRPAHHERAQIVMRGAAALLPEGDEAR